ncbi:MAG TPA: hypothetical protein VNO30_37930 [Kofleriaceae bacterium]|nr:hypothetical protein [Kofleriaceae bacterium]
MTERMTGAGRGGGAAARAAVAIAAAACGSSSPPPPGVQLAQAIGAAVDAAQGQRVPWRCAAPDGPKLADETLTAGKRAWKLAGGTMRLAGPAGDGAFTVGVVADAGGAAPTTIAALGALRGKLLGADLVLALGGMGASQAELEATLGALAEGAAWPVVALPGDLEPAGDQAAAIARLRAKGLVIIDGRLARLIELPGATIATIPGAGAAARLIAGAEGCGYRAADVATALGELSKREGLRILASAEAPRIAAGGEPAGELALTAGAAQPIDLALHGPTTEAATPARAGGRDGAAAALTPGSSDATTRLPGPRRAPSAGLLVVEGGAWRWKPVTGAAD